jgi:MioC protein
MRSMTPVTILVGSMTGNAEFAAEDLQQALGDEFGCSAELLLMDGVDVAVFKRPHIFLICTSTYGEGDVPENAQDLYRELCEQRPDLGGVRYAVFGLGDANYRDTFNFGGKRFDDILAALGAVRLAERVKHDALSGVQAGDLARDWLRGWYPGVG